MYAKIRYFLVKNYFQIICNIKFFVIFIAKLVWYVYVRTKK